ncbi:ABC transporter substrate-binding protein [Rummeliibacillus suwonensis]|uniref:ABC transporter substrate-binding protein n=1 Tax=Rummeliibacillus suwonensis TaxID=1306154 RepID=UPI0011B56BA3|nr:ABC transporter substrate-binding protein [Rummeliibacillus suwonensis]MBO2537129.1 ABC transporter substrate-binding protein [Rummeliibacillus suwonensis]
MKKWLNIVILLTFIIVAAGCNGKAQPKEENGKKLDNISIMLDWYPNAVHSAFYVAQEKGYFKEEGLNVKIEMPADTNDPLKLAATGKVDLAISYQNQTILSKSEGIPIISVAALVRHSLDELMMKKSSGIHSPKDLEGKNVGYSSSELSEAIIKTMVEADGGDFSKVKMTDVGWDLIPSVATDRVDAIIGGYINHEFVLLNKEGYDMKSIQNSDYDVPDNYELILVTGQKTFHQKRDAIKRFWKAVAKGQEEVKKNPKESLQILLDHENDSFPLDKDVETKSLEILLPRMEDDGLPFGYQEKESWEKTENWLFKKGVIKNHVNINDVMDNIVSK